MTGWDARMVMDDADRDPFRKEALSSNTTDCEAGGRGTMYGSDLAMAATDDLAGGTAWHPASPHIEIRQRCLDQNSLPKPFL